MAVDGKIIQRLADMGRERGFVTIDQVNQVLPVDHMSDVELAKALEQLERAGVSVEIDDILTPSRRLGGEPLDTPDFPLPDIEDEGNQRVVPIRPAVPVESGQHGSPPSRSVGEDAAVIEPGAGEALPSHRVLIVLAAAVLLVILAAVLLL
ncbi:hypothetical protein N825_13845 [Skermanella stibiiresistens SB22]|uniref:RNA polymerase sigma factor 70 region 1.1 domain-containing protein n=1 Tax=Skermanella stibiiresistens SB22 TaxID=1385369 RepID=W9H0B5_9PROT|nr:RNA polymerase sigma factor region1.1 domain-containing protein [Skermanella stibiiresistens]EWY38286.1 hypothetical protein N825_13845 [Skermanella stibiiresistens SB22]